MKKDFTNRTTYSNKTVRDAIKKWLKRPSMQRCPFQGIISCEVHGRELCGQVFPKIASPPTTCPCGNYTLGYVVLIAKQAVKALS